MKKFLPLFIFLTFFVKVSAQQVLYEPTGSLTGYSIKESIYNSSNTALYFTSAYMGDIYISDIVLTGSSTTYQPKPLYSFIIDENTITDYHFISAGASFFDDFSLGVQYPFSEYDLISDDLMIAPFDSQVLLFCLTLRCQYTNERLSFVFGSSYEIFGYLGVEVSSSSTPPLVSSEGLSVIQNDLVFQNDFLLIILKILALVLVPIGFLYIARVYIKKIW